MILTALALSTFASATPTISVSGTCPGNVTVTMSGLTPSANYSRMTADAEGSFAKPAGLCAGTVTGLDASNFHAQDAGVADAAGMAVLTSRLGARECNAWMQVMDLSTCEATSAALMATSGGDHLSERFIPDATQGQWCDSDALVRYHYYGETDYDTCEDIANATGTQWFVGQWTDYLNGWIGDQDGYSLAASSGSSDWGTEVIEARTTLRSCTLGWVDHRTEATISPRAAYYTDGSGRQWTYWLLRGQTHSQAMAFADTRGARILNGNQVGLTGMATHTAPTHWCHAGAMFNSTNSLNSDEIGVFIVGYWN